MMRYLAGLHGTLTFLLILNMGGCGRQQSNPLTQPASPASHRELPIEVIEDTHPASLRLWHLYENADATATVGDAITFIGQYRPESNYIVLQQPPWITVAFAPGKERGGNHPDTFQAFVVRPQTPPTGLDAHGYAHFKGVLKINQPGLSTDYKSQHDIPVFMADLTDIKAIPLTQPMEKLQQSCPAIIQDAEPRLRTLCDQYKLQYNFDASKLAMSWYRGSIAFTAPVTTYPRFSFTPIPYATISVLFAPETGKPAGLVLQRRIWQDPRD